MEQRRASEVKAAADLIRAPEYLPEDLKAEFDEVAAELLRAKIMTNLDVDALAAFITARRLHQDLSSAVLRMKPYIEYDDGRLMYDDEYGKMLNQQDKVYKQVRAAAQDLGLTISSRCKLVIPKPSEEKQDPITARFGEL